MDGPILGRAVSQEGRPSGRAVLRTVRPLGQSVLRRSRLSGGPSSERAGGELVEWQSLLNFVSIKKGHKQILSMSLIVPPACPPHISRTAPHVPGTRNSEDNKTYS